MAKFVLPDEDAWVLPAAWREGLSPRRGGLPAPDQGLSENLGVMLDTEQFAKRVRRIAERTVLFDRDLVAAGHRHLDGWRGPAGPTADARSAAVAALLADAGKRTVARALVSAWATRFGIEFTARAAGEMISLVTGGALWAIDPAPEKNYERMWRGNDLDSLISVARALRVLLVAAADDEYERATGILAGYRTSPVGRIITTYLVPTRTDWVDEDCEATAAGWPDDPDRGEAWSRAGHQHAGGLLLLTAGTVRHVELLRGKITDSPFPYDRKGEVGTMLDGVGPDAAVFLDDPFYRYLFFMEDDKPRYRERLNPDGIRLLATVPTDDAFRLLCRITLEGPLLRPGLLLKSGALTRFPVRALRILTELEAEGKNPLYTDLLGGHVLADPRLLPAAAGRLPAPVLTRAQEIVAVGGAGIGTAWTTELDRHYPQTIDSADDEKRAVAALAAIPTDEAFGLVLDRVERKHFRPALLVAAKRDPQLALRVLADRAPSDIVDELLRNHVLTYPRAVPDTLPTLTPEARARVEAITGPSVPATPATRPSAPAAAGRGARGPGRPGAVPAVLAAPPRRADGKPMRVPDLPEWLVLPVLPAVVPRDGDGVLPAEAVRNLCALVAASKIVAPHPAIAEVRAACDPRSLAAFAWAVFEQWRAAEYPARSNLAMVALALFGDDTTVPSLTSYFPSWASSSMRVRTGMDVLAAIGSDLALTHLHRLSRKARTAGFRRLAEQRLDDVAAARGLRPDQLADRIVPDFGLDADGRAVLDYGPRRFTIGFDEQFQAVITDQHGKRMARLPRPAAADDQDLARAAQRRGTELRKDVSAVATERTRALEEAMAIGATWTAAEFRRLHVEHPLMWQLTRRLLWTTVDERGTAVTAFRAAEDRTFADLDDQTWTLDPAATISVAHPWHFAADRAAWSEIFADYLLIQPFRQLSRELLTVTDLDPGAAAGAPAPSAKLYALTAKGWHFTDGHTTLRRTWPGDRTIEIRFEPGYHWQEPDLPQHLAEIRGDLTALTPVAVSELARDVRFLTSPS